MAMPITNNWMKVGALLAALALALSAVDLQNTLWNSQNTQPFDSLRLSMELAKAIQFQLAHALAIVLVGVVLMLRPSRLLNLSAYCFVAGSVLFSGSIYLWLITGVSWLQHLKLAGIVVLVIGWIIFVEGACPGWNKFLTIKDDEKSDDDKTA